LVMNAGTALSVQCNAMQGRSRLPHTSLYHAAAAWVRVLTEIHLLVSRCSGLNAQSHHTDPSPKKSKPAWPPGNRYRRNQHQHLSWHTRNGVLILDRAGVEGGRGSGADAVKAMTARPRLLAGPRPQRAQAASCHIYLNLYDVSIIGPAYDII
jgi:hypothetical protein